MKSFDDAWCVRAPAGALRPRRSPARTPSGCCPRPTGKRSTRRASPPRKPRSVAGRVVVLRAEHLRDVRHPVRRRQGGVLLEKHDGPLGMVEELPVPPVELPKHQRQEGASRLHSENKQRHLLLKSFCLYNSGGRGLEDLGRCPPPLERNGEPAVFGDPPCWLLPANPADTSDKVTSVDGKRPARVQATEKSGGSK
jgi:hypothetical protein